MGRATSQVITDSTQQHAMVARGHVPVIRFAAPVLTGVAVLAAVIALAGIAVLAYGRMHGPTIYRGVSAVGVPLSGLDQAEARARIEAAVQGSLPAAVELEAGDARWQVPLMDLGIEVDPAATAEAAWRWGRSGDLWADSRAWLLGLLGGYEVPLAVSLDEQAVYRTLEAIAPEVTRPARDARYDEGSDGRLVVVPEEDGVAIDVVATANQIRRRVQQLSTEPVPVVTISISPKVNAEALERELDRAEKLIAEPVLLTYGDRSWVLDPETLRAMLTVPDDGSRKNAELTIDRERLRASVASLAEGVGLPGRDATPVWDGQRFVVESAGMGEALDVDATVDAILAGLEDGERRFELRTRQVAARIGDAEAEVAAERATALVASGLTVTWPDGSQHLAPGELAEAIRFTAVLGDEPRLEPEVDMDALRQVLERHAPAIEIPMRNADLRYIDGQVVVRSPEQAGRALDVDASVANVARALETGQSQAELVTTPVEPQVTAAMAGSVQIREVLASAATYYAGALDNRRHNVELGVERANGALIPPGGVYSFIETVGAIDLNSGYKVGYGIIGTSNGSVSTVPSVGGGVCQVSTTVFQAAFWAGLPIVERNWHLYWLPFYGQPPSGLTGLDATVDTDWGLDLKFKNTTDDWIAIVAIADGEWVRVEIWGTDPGWTVQVDEPVVTNVVKADETMQYRESDQLPTGTSLQVERAQDGFDVSIHRQVLRDGEVIDDLTLRSQYLPSANVTLVGTG